MIKLELTANSVAELNTQMLNLLGFDTRCDECRAESEDEDYEEELCNCESCVAEREMTDCDRVELELNTPQSFMDWLTNTTYFTMATAYKDYLATEPNIDEVVNFDDFSVLLNMYRS